MLKENEKVWQLGQPRRHHGLNILSHGHPWRLDDLGHLYDFGWKPIWIIISDSTPSATWRERTYGHFGISLCWHHRRRGTSNVLQTGMFPARQYKKRNTGNDWNLGELIDQDCQEHKKKNENCYIFWSKIKNVTHFSRKPRQCFTPHPSLWRLIRQCQGTEASSFSWVFTFGRFVSAGMRQNEVGCWYLRLTKDIIRI